jgi:hypothetical protein
LLNKKGEPKTLDTELDYSLNNDEPLIYKTNKLKLGYIRQIGDLDSEFSLSKDGNNVLTNGNEMIYANQKIFTEK